MTLGVFIFFGIVILMLLFLAYMTGYHDARRLIASQMTSSEQRKYGLEKDDR